MRDKHLTPDPQGRIIVPGMAYFPGTGPEATHCIQCSHLVDIGYGKKGHKKKDCCRKFQEMRSDQGPTIGGLAHNRACKYFVAKQD